MASACSSWEAAALGYEEEEWEGWTHEQLDAKADELHNEIVRLASEEEECHSMMDANTSAMAQLFTTLSSDESLSDGVRGRLRRTYMDMAKHNVSLVEHLEALQEQLTHLTAQLNTFQSASVHTDPSHEFSLKLPNDIRHLSKGGVMGDLSEFRLIQGLGKGSFGAVFLVEHELIDESMIMAARARGETPKGKRKILALKMVPTNMVYSSSKRRRHVEIERRVMAKVRSHPFIVTMHYALQSPIALFFLMDYCAGGDLFYHLCQLRKTETKYFPQHVCRFFIAEVVLALGHIHAEHVVYRDLKPENIMLDISGHVKLVDFGLAKENVTVAHNDPMSPCGSAIYVAPEVLGFSGGYMTDWWSLGILAYELMTGSPPWDTKDRKELFKQIREKEIIMPPHVSRQAGDLIKGLLDRDPSRRLGAQGDADELKAMPFFTWPRGDWIRLERMEIKSPFNPCMQNQRVDKSGKLQLPINFDVESSKSALRALEALKRSAAGASPTNGDPSNASTGQEESTQKDARPPKIATQAPLLDFEPVDGDLGLYQRPSSSSSAASSGAGSS